MVSNVESGFLDSPDEVEGFHWDVLRPLSDEEFTSLKHGIAEDGIVSSIVLDRDRNILDGGHRLRAWRELLEDGYDIPRAPVQIRHDIGSEDGNAARLLARKLNMQRRQLSNLEKREVIKQQLRETPERSDTWIAEDLGVDQKTVTARRRELLDSSSDRKFRADIWPDQVWSRPSERYPTGQPQPYAERKQPKTTKPKKTKPDLAPEEAASPSQTTVDEQIEASAQDAPKTVSEALDTALSQMEESGITPEDAPAWPTHPSQEEQSKEAKRILQISSWMAGLSEYDPEIAADRVSATPADVDARMVIAEEVIDWFTKYRNALMDKRSQTTLRAVQ